MYPKTKSSFYNAILVACVFAFSKLRFASCLRSLRLFPSNIITPKDSLLKLNDVTNANTVEPLVSLNKKISKLTAFDATENIDLIRKWFLLNYQKRAEVAVSTSKTDDEMITDIFKSLLISFQVLDKNYDETKTFSCLNVFPHISWSGSNDDVANYQKYKNIETKLNNALQTYKVLFQPDFQYNIVFLLNNPNNIGTNQMATPNLPLDLSLIVLIDTFRAKEDFTAFYDIINLLPKNADELPKFENTITNQIPNFPFPSVYDFISEINRPVDPMTMSNLKFKFTTLDLRFNLEQMKKKKKNPQDYVDMINCQLTRLQKWRDVLTTAEYNDSNNSNPGGMGYDMFFNTLEWGEQIKTKYASMIVQARTDPKFAMDNQYDKRKVFVKIIDEWCLRLKQSFKFTYESKRPPPVDFLAPIMNSQWRAEVIQLTQLPAKVAFLDLQGPVFIPGLPKQLFNESRRVTWEKDYPVPLAMVENLVWIKYIEDIKKKSGVTNIQSASNSNNNMNTDDSVHGKYSNELFSYFDTFGSTTQHTYSRGTLTERVLYDCYQGLTSWIQQLSSTNTNTNTTNNNDIKILKLDETSDGILNEFMTRSSQHLVNTCAAFMSQTHQQPSSSSVAANDNEEAAVDHTHDFKKSLLALNQVSREASTRRATSVKEMYKQDFITGREITKWWTTLVRDLDMVSTIERVAASGDMRELDADCFATTGTNHDEVNSSTSNTNEWLIGWAAVMERVVTSSLKENEANSIGAKDDDIETKTALSEANKNIDLWTDKYRSVMCRNEQLSNILPWRSSSSNSPNKKDISGSLLKYGDDRTDKSINIDNEEVALNWLIKSRGRDNWMHDVVHAQFEGVMSAEYISYLFTAPCYFRGVGTSQELSAFLEFAKLIKSLLFEDNDNDDASTATPYLNNSLLSLPRHIRNSLTVLPLHPLMITTDGVPDYTRTAPHPCLLFRIPKSVFMVNNNNNN